MSWLRKRGRARGRSELLSLHDHIMGVALDGAGVERPIELDSMLAQEVATSTHEVARHFLSELPKHCAMLDTAIADVLVALDGLSSDTPFSAVVLTRGLLEASADLYWLSEAEIGLVERTRRTCLVYLRQKETQVRQIVQFSKRHPGAELGGTRDLTQAIREGWESLKLDAETMAAMGFELRESDRPGSKYSLGEPKPNISDLVDALVTRFLGKTGVNLYAIYSSIAHAEGEGLGTLLVMDDSIEQLGVVRYRRGLDDRRWNGLVLRPAVAAARGAVGAWFELALPRQAAP